MRMKIIAPVFLIAALACGAAIWYGQQRAPSDAQTSSTASTVSQSPDYKNATYLIDGVSTTLVNGYAAMDIAPGSASRLVTQYFGNEAYGNLTGNSTSDVAFLITQSGGGSGTFYYVVAALKTADGYVGTNAVLLGDRIAPQNTTIKDGEIMVNYADRAPNEPMTARPSIGVTAYFRVEQGVLTKVGG